MKTFSEYLKESKDIKGEDLALNLKGWHLPQIKILLKKYGTKDWSDLIKDSSKIPMLRLDKDAQNFLEISDIKIGKQKFDIVSTIIGEVFVEAGDTIDKKGVDALKDIVTKYPRSLFKSK